MLASCEPASQHVQSFQTLLLLCWGSHKRLESEHWGTLLKCPDTVTWEVTAKGVKPLSTHHHSGDCNIARQHARQRRLSKCVRCAALHTCKCSYGELIKVLCGCFLNLLFTDHWNNDASLFWLHMREQVHHLFPSLLSCPQSSIVKLYRVGFFFLCHAKVPSPLNPPLAQLHNIM